ncbi:MAG: iron ABC transporter permease [Ruminococcus sp.]|nr:iron ABC transporter permease [Ruminococcus sp.]
MGSEKKRCIAAFALLTVLFFIVFSANIFIGSTHISPPDVIRSLLGENTGNARDILRKIRIPRALAAMLLGGGLSLSGYLLQTFFHNPIAGPFVLGVSSGAKLTAAAAVIIVSGYVRSVSSGFMVAAAFAGAMLSLGFVLAASHKMNSMSMLAVCGIMIGYICSAITDFIVTFADDADIVNLHDWSKGTFSGTDMTDVKIIFPVTAAGFVGTLFISKPMSAYMLGENYARNSGVNIRLLKVSLVILSGLFSACVTAFAGPVSFVGIAVPHIAKTVFKTSRPLVMIPACFICGSIFCMLCDMIARTVLSPSELSISTVTAVFGAPVVIAVMIRRRQGELQ